jgi:dTDP-4-dehydrorhamnose 3,5-epimerase
MKITKLSIDGAWSTYSEIYKDERGENKEWFKSSQNLKQTGLYFDVAQSNYTKSKKGVIRGIHYSLNPNSQWKWISCLKGSIFDVLVDVRLNSPTFGKHESIILNESNGMGVLIQASLGHGFQSLSEGSIVVYNLSTEYEPEFEHSINPLDTAINVNWPLDNLILSEKDSQGDSLESKAKKKELPIQRLL